MPTTTSEKIRSWQERVQADLETIRQTFLEKGAAILEVQREIEQDLQEALREGEERQALLSTLATVRLPAQRWAELFRKALAMFEGDPAAAHTLERQLQETEDFLARVRRLEDYASKPIPPFDLSKLPPVPDGPTVEGYISVSEARARMRTEKKP